MVTHVTREVRHLRNSIVCVARDADICAGLDAEKRRVSRTEAAEGGTSAEIGGLVRLFFQ